MSGGVPRPGALRSSVGRMILIGQQTVRRVISGAACPLCDVGGVLPPGTHVDGCLVAEALLHDPVVVAQARAAREGERHG
jgi:hypothetical protein